MPKFQEGIAAYLKRIREEATGKRFPAQDIDDQRWNTERTHSVWKKDAPDHIAKLDWWIGLPGREIPVRLYRRKDAKTPPVILYLHGGGFVASSYDTHDAITWGLADATGALVISANYRRAPENPYPAALDDCYAVLEWIRSHGAWLDADTSRVAVAGDSAGGCLATALAMMVRDRKAAPLRMQALLYPCLDAACDQPSQAREDDPMLTKKMMEGFWEAYLPGQRGTQDPLAVPVRATNLQGLPPAYMVVGEYDPLRDECAQYAGMLAKAGVETDFRVMPGSIHGFLRARFVSEAARAEFARVAEALKVRLFS